MKGAECGDNTRMKTSTTTTKNRRRRTLTLRPDGSLVDYAALDRWIAARLRLAVVVDAGPMAPIYGPAISEEKR